LLPDFAAVRATVEAYPVDDAEIRTQIAKDYARYGRVWCPHTATGFWVYDHLPPARRAGHPWIVSATAHPAKFESIVEPLIGRAVEVPGPLRELLGRPASSTTIEPRLEQLAAEIDRW
jgi:threonine synthase